LRFLTDRRWRFIGLVLILAGAGTWASAIG